jgi:hypothetical protein
MSVPYTFGTATASIPLSQLDSNFATAITIGNTAVQLGNTITTFGNVSLSNATVNSLSSPITAAQGGTGFSTLTANNVLLGNGTSNVQLIAPGTSGNVLVSNGTTWTSNAATVSALGTPTSGNLTNCTADGTNGVGYINIPQNPQTGNYTLVASDAGKHIYHASGAAAATYTIPANSSVSYVTGTAVTFVNLSANAVTIAITTDTMYLSSAGTTGSRTLAQYGSATALKTANTTWIISGSGLT